MLPINAINRVRLDKCTLSLRGLCRRLYTPRKDLHLLSFAVRRREYIKIGFSFFYTSVFTHFRFILIKYSRNNS